MEGLNSKQLNLSQDFLNNVKEKVKKTFMDLIPDEAFSQMVEKEINAFFFEEQEIIFGEKDKYKEGSWHSSRMANATIKATPFRLLVWEHCFEHTEIYLKEKINKEYFGNKFHITEEELDDKMKKFIEESAPISIMKFFYNVII